MPTIIFCKCGKPAHPLYGDRCEDCYADGCTGLSYQTDIYNEGMDGLKPGEMKKEEIPNLSIAELDLETRTRNLLEHNGILLIGELVQKSATEILAITNFGDSSLREVEKSLEDFCLKLRPIGEIASP